MAIRGAGSRGAGVVALVAAGFLAVGVAVAGGAPVKASDYKFRPATITVQRGRSVTWKWVQGRHTVTFTKGSFDKALSRSHARRSRRFDQRGTFRYFCRFHRSLGMTGKVVVR